jgi:hypothetical protein
MSDLRGRGAASVKLVTLLDRQSARRVPLQPDYFGFLVDDAFLCGYGLGSPEQTGRNLPYRGSDDNGIFESVWSGASPERSRQAVQAGQSPASTWTRLAFSVTSVTSF